MIASVANRSLATQKIPSVLAAIILIATLGRERMISFEDAISLSLLLVYLVPIGLMFYNINYYVMLLAPLFVGSTTELVKPFIPSPRPKGAKDCNLFCQGGSVGGQPGFPSGHMGSAAVFVGLLYDAFPSPAVFLGGLLWLILMAYSRYTKHCHTLTQIVAGTSYGLAVALVIRITGIGTVKNTLSFGGA